MMAMRHLNVLSRNEFNQLQDYIIARADRSAMKETLRGLRKHVVLTQKKIDRKLAKINQEEAEFLELRKNSKRIRKKYNIRSEIVDQAFRCDDIQHDPPDAVLPPVPPALPVDMQPAALPVTVNAVRPLNVLVNNNGVMGDIDVLSAFNVAFNRHAADFGVLVV